MMKRSGFLLLPFLVFILTSCLGLSMDISMYRDGSGRVALVYQIPAVFENLGRLDGNENWPIVPIGRQDWERSVSRIDGLRLVTYSQRHRNNDYVTNVIIDFDNATALSALIGTNASVSENNLEIIFNDSVKNQDINSDLLTLMQTASSGKKISLSFTSRGKTSSLTLTNGDGSPASNLPSSLQTVSQGRNVSFSIDTYELLEQTEGFGVRVTW